MFAAKFVLLVVALIACRMAFAAEEEWTATPRAFTLTKGNAPTLATVGTRFTFPGTMANSVPQAIVSVGGNFFWIDEDAGAIWKSTDLEAAFATDDLYKNGGISSGGNNLYVLTTEAKVQTIVANGPTAGTPGPLYDVSTLITTLSSTVAFAPKLIPGAGPKGTAVDGFLIVEDGTAGQFVTIAQKAVSSTTSYTAIGNNAPDAATIVAAPVTCATAVFPIIGAVVPEGRNVYISAYDAAGAGAVIYKAVVGATGCTSVVPIAGHETDSASHAAGVLNTGKFMTNAPGFFTMGMALVGDSLYVSDRLGVSTVNVKAATKTVSPIIAGYPAIPDTYAIADAVGTYAGFKEANIVVGPSGKQSGVIYVADFDTNFVIRSVTWKGAPKTKVLVKKA